MSNGSCPSREQLYALNVGTLPEADAGQVIAHLSTCVACQAAFETLCGTDAPLDAGCRRAGPTHWHFGEPECRAAVVRAEAILGKLGPRVEGPLVAEQVDEDLPHEMGEYRLLEKLGQGGMGVVYKALHTNLGRLAAVKVLPGGRADREYNIARFYREMKAIGQLDHPNIVRAYDAREIDGVPVLVTEYVEGADFSKVVRHCAPLSIADACELVRQAAVGVQYAHEQGLVHRDIKPSNLILATSGQSPSAGQKGAPAQSHPANRKSAIVKILDLGLALLREPEAEADALTVTGQVMGTLDYMAPEQLEDSHEVDARADVYSLGATLYKLLCGVAPFEDSRYNTRSKKMYAVANKPILPIRERRLDLPDQLAAAVDRALEKDPEERFPTAAELAAAVAPFAAGCHLPALARRIESGLPAAGEAVGLGGDTDKHPPSAAVDTNVSHRPAPAQVQPSRRRPPRRAIWMAAALSGMLLLGVIVTVVTNKGTLVVEVPEGDELPEDVGVVVSQGGLQVDVLHKENHWKVSVASGEYSLALRGGGDQIVLDNRSVIVKRLGRTVVIIRKSEASQAELKKPDRVDSPGLAMGDIASEPWSRQPGSPLSLAALVSQPAAVRGVHSWTVETVGHRGIVYTVAYSPAGDLLASGADDGVVRVWNGQTGELVRVLIGHDRAVYSIAWSPDGRYLASGGLDATVRIWDVASGKLWRTYQSADWVRSVAWSPLGRQVAGSDRDGKIQIWDISAGKLLRTLQGPAQNDEWPDGNLAWSPDGATLVAGGERPSQEGIARLVVWDVESAELKHSHDTSFTIASVAWSPDGKTLAASEFTGTGTLLDRKIYLFDGDTGDVVRTLEAGDGGASSIAWSPDGQMLVGVGWPEKAVRVWNVDTGQAVGTEPLPRADFYPVMCVDWSRQGAIAVAGHAGALHIRRPPTTPERTQPAASDSETMRILTKGVPRVRWAEFSQVGDILGVASHVSRETAYYSFSVWDWPSGELRNRLPAWGRLSHDGTKVAHSRSDRVVVQRTDSSPGDSIRATEYSREPLHSAWSSDDTRFAVAFKQGVQIWDTEKAALLRKVAPVGERLAWSPTGNTLAIGTPQSIQLVDAESGEVKGVLNRPGSGYSGSLKGLEWSPNGERMACFDGWNVCLFDVQSAELLGHCKHEGGEGFGSCLAWFDDGRRFATGTNGSGDIRIWETDPLRLSRVVPRLAGEVAVVSPGGRFACYSSGNTVRIQDLQNDKQTCALLELEGDAYVAASANGHFRGSPGIEKQLVYVVRTDRGQETVTPAEFAQRYGWKNEPDRVSVTDGNQPAGS